MYRMRRLMTWRVTVGVMIGLCLGWLAGGYVSVARGAYVLPGTWKVEVTPDEQAQTAGEKEFKDTVTFKVDDTFSSEAFKKRGFKDDKAEINQPRFGPAEFSVTLKS